MFRDFSEKKDPFLAIFQNFPGFALKIGPIVRDFFMKNGTHV